MRREKSRYLLGGGDGRRADDFGFFRVIARNEVSAQQEQDCFQNQNVGFRFEMNRRMFSVNLVNYDTENRNV